ncbi:MAG TPA: sigma 54-interacting transcriptional regulator [Planctomycetota bacterium]|nr:sigma 54-interacting transcriptional regulator [Planctomycetota bacterium]
MPEPPDPATVPAAAGSAADALLTQLADAVGVGASTDFLPTVVQRLTALLGVRYALVGERTDDGNVTGLAYQDADNTQVDVPWAVEHSPCAEVLAGRPLRHLADLRGAFPKARVVRDLGLQSYVGVPLPGPDGAVLGHLCVFDSMPLHFGEREHAIFRIFAGRAAAELMRRRLERTLGESQERFRDLFDEAPIAYVHEGLDSRFLRANRAALRILGVKPENAVGTYGKSLAPDTPEAQERLRLAFESVGRGTDTSGVVLELRRQDDGRPVFIQWWSRPDPSGTYTRTMFLDITERVLMEREQSRLRAQNEYLQEEIKAVHDFDAIIGGADVLQQALEHVKRVAPTDATVLITGETGTGKELIARAIHSASRRRDKPLIKLNCAALPAGLVESELFGHEKGAFSGAIARRIGRFELAQGGTIFLDEIGEVPMDVQVKLLRVLQEHEFERVGGGAPIRLDVRVIAATNRDLDRAIAENRFRSDLFYRLNVFPIALPPLRQREGDIPLLVRYFLRKFAARVGKRVEHVSPELLARFAGYAWPGNIRELENLVERAVILANGDTLDVDAVPFLFADRAGAPVPQVAPGPGSLRSMEAVEREHVLAALQQSRWVIAGDGGAAAVLGLHPNTLRSRMEKLGITRPGRA